MPDRFCRQRCRRPFDAFDAFDAFDTFDAFDAFRGTQRRGADALTAVRSRSRLLPLLLPRRHTTTPTLLLLSGIALIALSTRVTCIAHVLATMWRLLLLRDRRWRRDWPRRSHGGRGDGRGRVSLIISLISISRKRDFSWWCDDSFSPCNLSAVVVDAIRSRRCAR